MDLEVSIYRKREEDRNRYWVGIATAEQDENGEALETYINASLLCNMSKNAATAYNDHAVQTSNPEIRKLRCLVTSGWFKAVRTKSGTAPVLFVNGIAPAAPRKVKRSPEW